MHGLLRVTLRVPGTGAPAYPFDVPAVRAASALAFPTPVTFFVGENGSGKSTLLEGIAAKVGLPAIGTASTSEDGTLSHARRLASVMRAAWGSRGRTRRGFFLRSEDFFGFTRSLQRQQEAFQREAIDVDEAYRDRSDLARALRLGPIHRSLAGIRQRYGDDVDGKSHGETFLGVLQARGVPDGLHLLDEPEAGLSPTSQLALLQLIGTLVAQGAQFIVATHSPILLACPGATILTFDECPPRAIEFGRTEHVRLTRDFLTAPERYLRHLSADDPTPRRTTAAGARRR